MPPTFQRRTGSLAAFDLQTVTQGGFRSRLVLTLWDQKRLTPHPSRREQVAMRVPQTPHLYHQPPSPQNKQEAVSPQNKQGAVSPQNKQEAVSPQNKQEAVSPLRALPLLLHTTQQP